MGSSRAARVVGCAALGLIVTALLVQAAARGTGVATTRSEAAMGIILESTCENPRPKYNFKGRNMFDHPILLSHSHDCLEKCSQLNGCVGWTFIWGNHQCWPKATIESDMFDDRNVESCLHEAAKSEAPNQGSHEAAKSEAPNQGPHEAAKSEAPNQGPHEVAKPEAPNHGHQGVSLFCFAMTKAYSYEVDLLRRAFHRGAGIFACDSYAIFSSKAMEVVPGINAIQVDAMNVGVSEDRTAANTEQFMKVWDGVKHSGKLYNADWTLKLDPDCVFLPWKLRPKLAAHNGRYAFVRNCNAWPGEEKFPCMFGAIEILSKSAASTLAQRKDECRNLPTHSWAEDLFITKCLEQLWVHPIDDMSVVDDGQCSKSMAPPGKRPPPKSCQQDRVAAFHPFKDSGAWEACLDQAMRAQ